MGFKWAGGACSRVSCKPAVTSCWLFVAVFDWFRRENLTSYPHPADSNVNGNGGHPAVIVFVGHLFWTPKMNSGKK